MPVSETLIITILFFASAALYASVGHAGASAYLAVMGLYNFAPSVMKPTALSLNILVAAVATFKFYRAGLFSWRLFWPFAVASVPAAFVGGATVLPVQWYRVVVGVVLLYAAVWMFSSSLKPLTRETHPPSLWVALAVGLGLGFLSGAHGRRRWNLPESPHALSGLGRHTGDVGGGGAVHPRQLDCGIGRTLLECGGVAPQHRDLGSGGVARRIDRSNLWEQARTATGAEAAAGTRARSRERETDSFLR